MPRYFIQLAYNGTNYNGWQAQDNTTETIQQILQDKMSLIIGETIEVVGCGRTDTGVHAKEYYAHFDSAKADLHLPGANYVYKLNKVLPFQIAVSRIRRVKDNASARFDAEMRTYEYLVHRFKDPFLFSSSLYVFGEIDFNAMNEAAAYLLQAEDFI